jgi:protein TonB
MGYQALLFCPDEKTARTVTQVLGELEFTVEACSEPFAAVKKLMGEHFDAVVVDCDNEQNATLLFKSARNSTSNQTSLAVAVVEGQAGVAKAFRIGANLVLTKPINIEQTKGTLRVARGLLRKADPAKPSVAAAPATAGAPQAAAKAAPKPAPVAKPVVPAASVPVAPSVPKNVPVEKPAPAVLPAAAVAKSAPAVQAGDLFEKPVDKTEPVSAPAAAPQAVGIGTGKASGVWDSQIVPVGGSSGHSSSGTASAAAPAREPQAPRAVEPVVESAAPAPATTIERVTSEAAPVVGSAPTFSYGASTTESSGGNKKIFIGIAAAVVIGIAGYFGWAHFSGKDNSAAVTSPSTEATAPVSQPTKPVLTQPTASATVTSPAPVETAKESISGARETSESFEPAPKETASHSAPKSEKSSAAPPANKPAEEERSEPEPLMVKGGKVPVASPKSGNTDAAAPSMIGMATPESAPPPALVPSTTPTFKPVLQTVSVSQGVSQGLLYKKVAPVYPVNAIRMRVEGKVELMATISKEGNISQVKVLSGDGQLSKAAVEAVKQWKYKPYLLNGEPVEIQTQVSVNFKLPN